MHWRVISLLSLGSLAGLAFLTHTDRAQGESTSAATQCPAGTVLVAGGTATLGAPDDPNALPPMTRTTSAFCLDRTEVTVAQYLACVKAGGCRTPDRTVNFPGFGPPEPMRTDLSRYCNVTAEDRSQHPMNCIDHETAARYCTWAGGRLPDEEEWEYAARGATANRFPWGSAVPTAPGGDLCWDRRATAQGTCAVGQFAAGASPSGALDMAGNVWEWTSTRAADAFIVRGGGWTNFLSRFVSTTYRWPLGAEMRLNCVGFRCVRPGR